MYAGLEQALTHAKSLGLRTTVTTNGFFTTEHKLNRMRGLVDVLAISLDGPAELHNRIRGSERAFDRLQEGLEKVRASEIPFGIIHTLTQDSWEHLLWVADFAASNQASLLQIHPLESVGRANERMRTENADDDVMSRVYVLAFAVANKYRETMRVQLDLLYRDHLRDEPELIYAGKAPEHMEQRLAPELHGLLVMEPDGTLVPVSYGFSRNFRLCNVREQKLSEAWPNYLANRYSAFKSLCQSVWEEMASSNAPLLGNWHEIIVARSHSFAGSS